MSAGNSNNGITADDLARLPDAELRQLILDRIDTVPANGADGLNPADIAYRLQEAFATAQDRLGDILGSYKELPGAMAAAWRALTSNRAEGGLGEFLIVFLISLGIAWVGSHQLKKLKQRIVGTPEDSNPGLLAKARHLALNLLGDGIRIGAFAAIAALVFMVIGGDEPRDRLAFFFYLSAVLMMQAVIAFLRAYLALPRPDYRIPAFTDPAARSLYHTQIFAMALGAFGFFTCALFAVLGVTGDAHYLLLIIVGSLLSGGLVLSFISNRAALTGALVIDGITGIRTRLAPLYGWALAVATLLIWFGVILSGVLGSIPLYGAALFTVLTLTFWPPIDSAIAAAAITGTNAHDPIRAAALRVSRLILTVAVIIALMVVWRVDVFTASEAASLNVVILQALLQICAVLLIAYTAWEVLCIWLDRRIAVENAAYEAERGDVGEMEIGGAGLSRLGTLLPLFKRTGQVTIVVIALMIILSALGVDIGPVLAGAGVVGLAIGFGSQTLVRDIVSGAFFLIDDAFRQGEYIDLGTVKGSVEKIRARSLQLRHHRGALNTIPFGEISTIQNYSRDWAIMKLKFRLPFDTDLEKVRKLLKKTGQQLLEHPEVGEDFIQPFKSQGVVEVDDYGLIISTKFMCHPGRQYLIRRYAYAAVQTAFAENGISFSRPEIRVAVGDNDEDRSEEIARATAAAAISSQQRMAARDSTGGTNKSTDSDIT